jgi:exodeoxyribonuclease VII large subunit
MIEKLSLTELQLIIRDSLYTALPGFYWVMAEISEIKENYAGHCYLELIEKHTEEENVRARVRGIIWSKRYRFLKPLFENVTGESLRDGIKVLIRAKIEYHEVYGLSLVINDIDPAFTLGEMALKRQQIIRKLESEGVISMNRELEFPILPKRIAIISSKNAAGYSDFIKHLTENSRGYVFNTALFESVMQGQETEISVISALNRISEYVDLFDVVVIIRGGGSQSDLSWFDNYNLAYHITQFPLPVITGIGHEKDMSVTDLVAFRAEKTPTAAADSLVNCTAEAEDLLLQLGSEISNLSASAIKETRARIDTNLIRLIPNARMLIASEKERLSSKVFNLINFGKDWLIKEEFNPGNQRIRLISAVKNYSLTKVSHLIDLHLDLKTGAFETIKQSESTVESFRNKLNILDPVNVLRRGYTITSVNGRIITNIEMVRKDDEIKTLVSNGSVISKVTETT